MISVVGENMADSQERILTNKSPPLSFIQTIFQPNPGPLCVRALELSQIWRLPVPEILATGQENYLYWKLAYKSGDCLVLK